METSEAGSDEDSDLTMPQQPFQFYLTPNASLIILSKRWVEFTAMTALTYVFHLIFAIYGVDKYTDITQNRVCKTGQTIEEAASIY